MELKTTTYKNTTVAYSDSGKGTTVVLLHGFLENQKMWAAFIPELEKKHRVLTVDLLGHGATSCKGYIHEMEDQAAMIHDLLTKLRIRKAVFLGHSMGGYVALAFAELYPEFMKGLILVNSTSKADSLERKANRDRAIKAVKKDYTSFVRLSIANLFSEINRTTLIGEIESVKLQALQTPLQGIVAALEGMKIRKDREFLLYLNSYPKMIVLGKQDPVLNYEENLGQLVNTSVKLVVFPDGHMSHIENQSELKLALLGFLKII